MIEFRLVETGCNPSFIYQTGGGATKNVELQFRINIEVPIREQDIITGEVTHGSRDEWTAWQTVKLEKDIKGLA